MCLFLHSIPPDPLAPAQSHPWLFLRLMYVSGSRSCDILLLSRNVATARKPEALPLIRSGNDGDPGTDPHRIRCLVGPAAAGCKNAHGLSAPGPSVWSLSCAAPLNHR